MKIIQDNKNNSQDVLANIFEERAEHLSAEELEKWTIFTQKDEAIIEKLKGPGAKLLTGPRGSGKSTLLRTTYFRLIRQREALPVYVNYARSLALEPLFHKSANALQLFRQWLLMKIVVGSQKAIYDMQLSPPSDLVRMATIGKSLIKQLELGEFPQDIEASVSPSGVLEMLESLCDELQLKRCVLLLDDAAHAFSPEQQREFFEVFRELRSRKVAGKAAVYPGITSYSPHFHVGHEAELIEAWYRPDDSDFLETMRTIVQRRLPPELQARFSDKSDFVDLLALASFGLPRGFLNMLSTLLSIGESSTSKPNRQRADRAIREHTESVRGIFNALGAKLPRYRHFVEVGEELEQAVCRTLQKYNNSKTIEQKTPVLAIEEPISAELDRMLKMLEYAGILRKLGSISRGVVGRFQRYSMHYGILITENALSLGKSYSVSAMIASLINRDSHSFARTRPNVLLGRGFEKRCTLDLPPCKKCKTARIAEEQRFCMKCGSELANASIYEELLGSPIERLPLTSTRIAAIKKHTKLKTVQDILLDDERQTIRDVPYVGPFWAAKIRTRAEEFVSV